MTNHTNCSPAGKMPNPYVRRCGSRRTASSSVIKVLTYTKRVVVQVLDTIRTRIRICLVLARSVDPIDKVAFAVQRVVGGEQAHRNATHPGIFEHALRRHIGHCHGNDH
jgi:hypothetical protein